jgi:hypothetical protein
MPFKSSTSSIQKKNKGSTNKKVASRILNKKTQLCRGVPSKRAVRQIQKNHLDSSSQNGQSSFLSDNSSGKATVKTKSANSKFKNLNQSFSQNKKETLEFSGDAKNQTLSQTLTHEQEIICEEISELEFSNATMAPGSNCKLKLELFNRNKQ